MRFILETITGRKGIKNFSSLEEYVDFMTKNGDKIKNIVESDLPYDDKPVSVATPSQSNGWEQVNKTTFGDVIKKAEKGDCVLPHKASSVFKDEAKFEPSKSSEKTDTSSEPKVDSTPVKNNNEGSEKDLPKFEYKDESKSSSETSEKSEPKEEKKEKKQVDEGLGDKIHDLGVKAKQKLGISLSGKELEDYINEYLVYAFMDICNKVSFENNETYQKIVKLLIKADSKFAKFFDAIRTFIANETATFQMPLERVNKLSSKLVQMGVDKEIVNKAYKTFMSEEMNSNKEENFDSEIAETLRLAGVQLNEAEDDILELDEYDDDETDESEYDNVDNSLIDKIANDPKVYNQGRDENDDGQEPDAEKIINSIDYIINNYGLSGRQALKAYSKATFMDYDMVKDAWESDGSAWDENDMPKTEDVNNPNDGDVDEKTGKEKLMEEDPSANFNQDEVDNLMAQYERAESDYNAADFYDDNYSWNKGRNSASSRMSDIENKLKQLTGKSYKELLDTLGSKQVDEDKGPSFKVGDKFNKNGRTYEIEKIEKSESKSRDHQYTNYWYHVREVNGSHVDVFTDSLMKELGFKPIAQ